MKVWVLLLPGKNVELFETREAAEAFAEGMFGRGFRWFGGEAIRTTRKPRGIFTEEKLCVLKVCEVRQ